MIVDGVIYAKSPYTPYTQGLEHISNFFLKTRL